ncbi:DUF3744 domain-containing protein, partial [Escherichia coli]|nr:DUF3744 domain-containing protein [Escherichia coli]
RSVDRIILMESGEIIADTTPDEILASPLLEDYGIREPLYISALKEAGCAIEGDAKPSSLTTLPLEQYKPAVQAWFDG